VGDVRGSGRHIAALIVASILWGTTGTAASFLPSTVSPLAVGASTMGIGGILLFLVSARASLAAIRDRVARRWLLIGAVGVVVYPLAFYTGMSMAGVAIGNVVALGTGPVFAALLEWFIERRGLDRQWVISTAIAIVGICLLGSSRVDDAAGLHIIAGIVFGVLAGLAYALYTYASSRAIGAGQASGAVMGGMFGLGAIALVPVLLVVGGPLLTSASTVGIAAYLALGPMFLAYVLFGVGLRSIRSSAVTTITLLEPIIATVLAVAVVGERLAWFGWIGLLLIMAGVTLVATARQGGNSQQPT
jgi:drug/metabolite transporter, DME family